MERSVWFGTVDGPRAKMQWIKAPLTGMGAGDRGYAEDLQFDSGRGEVVRALDYQRTYEMEWLGSDYDETDIDTILAYQRGMYGAGPFYLADIMTFEKNVLRANWADPALRELGYRNILDQQTGGAPLEVEPTYTNTVANTYDQPGRTATWTPPAAPGTTRTWLIGRIPVPDGYRASIAVCGSADVGGGSFVPQVRIGGQTATTYAPTVAPVWSAFVEPTSGYANLEVVISSPGTGAPASLSITSIMVQLTKAGVVPPTPAKFEPGLGASGLNFNSNSTPYTYTIQRGHVRSMSATLVEVEESKQPGA